MLYEGMEAQGMVISSENLVATTIAFMLSMSSAAGFVARRSPSHEVFRISFTPVSETVQERNT